ncbi:Methyltransferase type 11 [Amycolatopsis camponoti]|uniref:Methyltransferase type 11 n=1 Tax=Amycolatopsis camponoti TaxID=2606593 RepID=A0A6I8LWU6_9PSEU|nr:class I SAM-dependent methyltransferase [Amycolatopsis camponoti]VVJ21692.1 Methyltransferase type 11 [Amycolatopsis camponoti]
MPSTPVTLARTHLPNAVRRARHAASGAENLLQRALVSAGARQSEARIAADAQDYWQRPADATWRGNSHWRDAPVFGDSDLWNRLGTEHLAMFDAGARMCGFDRPWQRVLEWGCGGGANAVHFAPRATEFVGVDISPETLVECEKQVGAVCDTPVRSIAIDVADPESAVPRIGGPCDVFLSFYVFELVPTPEYGERLLRIAHDVLAPGGLALIQVKYSDGRWRTRSRRRAYRRGLAEMTTYPIDEFWRIAQRCGFAPQAVQLVPRNELDERYAYFFLRREPVAG